MRYFPLLFTTCMMVSHVYIFWCLRRAWRPGIWQYGMALSLVLVVGQRAARRFVPGLSDMDFLADATYFWMGFIIMLSMCLAFRDVLALAAWAADRWRGTALFRFFGSKSIRIAMLAGVAAFAYGLYEARAIRIRTVTIHTERLPAGLERLRLVLLTDLHLAAATDPAVVRRIADMVNIRQPDLVLLVGDVMDAQFSPDGEMAKALGGIRAAAGKFAVSGNHDVYTGLASFAAFMEGAGFEAPRGRFVDRAGIRIVGVDDPRFSRRRELAEVVREAATDAFILVLSHTPEVPEDARGRFDLELSGHTHGGQIWPLGLAVRYMYGFRQGLTTLPAPAGRPRAESMIYITNGTRSWGPPIRFLAPPEITVIDLVR